jgi:hypothetical protein
LANPFKEWIKSLDAKLASLDYDHHIDIYRDRAKELAAKATGVERLAYDILGPSLMGSIAYALDPLEKLKFIPTHVAPINRRRELDAILFQRRYYSRKEEHDIRDWWVTHWLAAFSHDDNYHTVFMDTSYEIFPQEEIRGFLYDTSRRTRQKDDTQGEFELYAPKLSSPAFNKSRLGITSRVHVDIPGLWDANNYYREHIHWGYTEPAARIVKSDHDTWLASYRSDANSLIESRALELIAKALPTHRRFNLSYNIAELRELPSLLRQSAEFFRRLYRSNGKAALSAEFAGNSYLAYKFGWESTYQAIRRMLDLPAQINKEINHLIDRAGKPTTFHSRIRFTEDLSSSPPLSFDYSIGDESFEPIFDSKGSHSVELRCALNCNVPLPLTDIPQLRSDLLLRKWGTGVPTPEDVFNIVPWTWLIDWFTGVGDYLNIIDAIAFDKSIINYALVSFVSKGEVNASFQGKSVASDGYSEGSPPVGFTDTRIESSSRSATFSFRYHLRKDGLSLPGVDSTYGRGSLTDYQTSIIGALVAKYGNKSTSKK